MNEKFKEIINQLPGLLERLVNSPPKPRNNLGSLPRKGIYVFFENEHPIYVGRTNRMKDRIKEHGRPSSNNSSAPFAFNLAKKIAVSKGIDVSKPRRMELEKNSTFASLFSEVKEKVSRMSVRVIAIDDPIIQTLFEVYASVELNTEFNDFNTH